MNSTSKPFTALLALPKGALTAREDSGGTLLVENDQVGKPKRTWSDKATCGEWTSDSPYGYITCLKMHPDGKQIIAGTSLGFVGLLTLETGLRAAFKKDLSCSFHYAQTLQVPSRSPGSKFPIGRKPCCEDKSVSDLTYSHNQGRTVIAVTGQNRQSFNVRLEDLESEKLRHTSRPESIIHRIVRSVTSLAKMPALAPVRYT